MRNKSIIISFVAGILLATILFFSVKSCFSTGKKEVSTDYYVLTNQIQKMNKMVVMEQNTSAMQKTSFDYTVLGQKVSGNQIITFTKTNAQVSYDLSKMKMEVDSVNKKLIIKELPDADIRITPNVEIQSMDDSFLNRISQEDIKKVTSKSKENAIKSIDQNRLRTEGREQLMQNLDQIFVLAKALHYTIDDQTGKLQLLN